MTLLTGYVWRVEVQFGGAIQGRAECWAIGQSAQDATVAWLTRAPLGGEASRAMLETIRSAYAWRSPVEVEVDDDSLILDVRASAPPTWVGTVTGPVRSVLVKEDTCLVTIRDRGVVDLGLRFSMGADAQEKRRAANAAGVLVSAMQVGAWVVARHDMGVMALDFVAPWDPLWQAATRFDDRYAPAVHTHGELGKLASEIQVLRDALDQLVGRSSTLETRTSTLETRTGDLETRVGAVEAGMTALGARTTTLETAASGYAKAFAQVAVDLVTLTPLTAPLSQLDVALHLPKLADALTTDPSLRVEALEVTAGVWNGAGVYQRALVVDLGAPTTSQGPWPITLWDTRDAVAQPYRDPPGPALTTRLTVTALLRR